MTHQNKIRLFPVFLVLFVFLLCQASIAGAQNLKLKVGDVLSLRVVSLPAVSGTFEILSDGTIESHFFGIIQAAGSTIPEVRQQIRARLAQKVKSPVVSLILTTESPTLVFLSGSKVNTGPLKLVPGMDLQQLLSSVELDDSPDLFEAHLFRAGSPERTASVQKILNGLTPLSSFKLVANDVISLQPLPFVRVWITGEVIHPGEVALRKGDDIYRALAAAGGPIATAIGENESRVALRRGPNTTFYPLKERPSDPRVLLEPGDTVLVSSGDRITVTVLGEVKLPGKEELRAGSILDQAVAGAGGITTTGTGREVSILRDGKTLITTASTSTSNATLGTIRLEDHDVILVKQNTRYAIAVGYVKTQGRVYLPDGLPQHLLDVIVGAGGIVDRGTSRHVFVGHPDAAGIMKIREYRLDQFLKDGNAAGNPLIEPGDIVSVQPSQPATADVLQQVLSGAALLYGVSKL